MIGLALAWWGAVAAQPLPYQDPAQSLEARAADLVTRMTLELPLKCLGVYAADASGEGSWRILPGEQAFEVGGRGARLTLAAQRLD